MSDEIIIVSGLPRSGTSLMMQMLQRGGVAVMTDNIRTADTDNPRGYYELEKVKQIKQDSSWLAQMHGKAFKMVSQLLYDLPASESYRIVFMERDVDELLLSQEKMLQRLGRPTAPAEEIKQAFTIHLERLHRWLRRQENMRILTIRYNDLMERPEEESCRVSDFLGGKLTVESMVKSVDPSLYRNRKTTV